MVRDNAARHRSFNQRRGTLFSMARELSEEFGAHVAVIAFSPSGEPHAFGGPTVGSVLRAYLPGPADAPPSDSASPSPSPSPSPGGPRAETVGEAAARVAGMRRQLEEIEALVASEYRLLAAAAGKIRAAQASQGKQNWWEVEVDALGEEELPVFAKALEMLRADVQARLDKMASSRQLLPPRKE